jgi:hypothetical protein
VNAALDGLTVLVQVLNIGGLQKQKQQKHKEQQHRQKNLSVCAAHGSSAWPLLWQG